VTNSDRDIVSARMWTLGTVGVQDLGDHLRAAFADRDSAIGAAAALGIDPVIESVRDDEGLDTWREFASWVEAGPFVICPRWITPPEGTNTILIDPGYSFGSGSHPSTRLAVEALARVIRQGTNVLDVGCGSGVLSIAAARLGASVTAVDTDPAAVEAANANAMVNGCSDAVRVSLGSAADIERDFDLVVVNVTIDMQESLAADIADRLAAAGTLVASGILRGPQEARLAGCHPELNLIARVSEAEWVAVSMRRQGPRE